MYDFDKTLDIAHVSASKTFQKETIEILYAGDPGNKQSLIGIFMEDIKSWDVESASMVNTGVSGVDVRLSQFTTEPEEGTDKIKVGSTVYIIRERNDDKEGGTLLVLGDDL